MVRTRNEAHSRVVWTSGRHLRFMGPRYHFSFQTNIFTKYAYHPNLTTSIIFFTRAPKRVPAIQQSTTTIRPMPCTQYPAAYSWRDAGTMHIHEPSIPSPVLRLDRLSRTIASRLGKSCRSSVVRSFCKLGWRLFIAFPVTSIYVLSSR